MIDRSDAVGFPVPGFAPLPRVVEVVCTTFGVTLEEIRGRTQRPTALLARSAIRELGREFAGASPAEIRLALGQSQRKGGYKPESQRNKGALYFDALKRARVVLREGAGG